MQSYSLSHLANPVLIQNTRALAAQDRATLASLLAHLAEVDSRQLFLPAGYSSMVAWCIGELKLSEDEAFKRLRVARAGRAFPALLPMIADGRLTLTTAVHMVPHLTPHDADGLFAAAAGRTKADVELLLARRFPRPDLAEQVRPLAPATPMAPQLAPEPVARDIQLVPEPVRPAPQLAPGPVAVVVAPRPTVAPLSPGRFGVQFTMSQHAHDQLRYAQALLGHALPSRDLALVIERALDALVEKLEQQKLGRASRCGASRRRSEDSRHIPAAVRRVVWERDGGRCTFVSEKGHRCEATSRLEFDHIQPFARGGQATPSQLRLRCRAHNQFEAERTYGRDFMRHKREESKRRSAETRAVQALGAATARRRADVVQRGT